MKSIALALAAFLAIATGLTPLLPSGQAQAQTESQVAWCSCG